MSAITVSGDLVHYEVLGRGRIVVLLHGWLGSWHYWIPLMRQLQLKYRVYAVDLFGFGDSGKNPMRYTIEEQVKLVDEFMRQLGIPKAGMIGHGLGAQVLTEFASQYPERVARMMLTSAPLFDPGDLANRVPTGQRVLLTPSNNPDPFNRTNQPLASKSSGSRAANPSPSSHSDKTIARRPEELDEQIEQSLSDATIVSATNETIVNPNMIDRAKLREAALARGASFAQNNTPSPTNASSAPSGKNPLREALSGGLDNLLLRCFKRADTEYDKLQAYISRTDTAVIAHSVKGFDAGRILDQLRLTNIPTVIVHGESDPLIPVPSESVWDYLTQGKEESLLPVPLPNVRHFPMLESDPYIRLVGSFLDTPDISKIEIKERWRRRSR